MEPVLVACLVGACLNMPQLNCLFVIVVSMGIYLPFLLSGVTRRIQVKMVSTMVLLAFVFLFFIFKFVIYFMKYPSFVENTYMTDFLGIFFGYWIILKVKLNHNLKASFTSIYWLMWKQ